MLKNSPNINKNLIYRVSFWVIFWANFGAFIFYLLDFFTPLISPIWLLSFGYFELFFENGSLFLLSFGIFGLIGGIFFQNKLSIILWAITGAIYWSAVGLIYNTITQFSISILFVPFSLYWEDWMMSGGLITTVLITALSSAIICGIGGFIGTGIIVFIKNARARNARGTQNGFIIGVSIIAIPLFLFYSLLTLFSYVAYNSSMTFFTILEIALRSTIVAAGTGGLLGLLIGSRKA